MQISEKINAQKNVQLDLYPSFKGRTLNIEIATGCNEKCIYCQYYAKGVHRKAKLIDEDFFYRITKEAYDLGITDVGLYMKGEPLINPKIYDYVDYLKHTLGFPYVYISTNGILLNPENLDRLVKGGIDSIKFSVSGYDRKSFLQHHGVDAFDRVYENIKYAYEYRKKNNLDYKLFMFSIITRYNQPYKERIKKLYSPYVDEIIMSNVMSFDTVCGVEELLSVPEEKTVISGIVATIPCMQLFNRISIDENGYLLPCCFDALTRQTVMKDLHNCSLKDAVYSDEMVALRKRHLEHRIQNTICDYCVNGNACVREPISELARELGNESVPVDMTEEIKRRFGLD